jgi:hypothetical protein
MLYLMFGVVPEGTPVFSNFLGERTNTGGKGKGKGKATVRNVPVTEATLAARLSEDSGGWPRRVGGVLFAVEDGGVLQLDSEAAFYGWVTRQYLTPIEWANATGFLTQSNFYESLRQGVEKYDAVETLPHLPELPGHYYVNPADGYDRGGGGRALAGLVKRLNPATEADRHLVTAMLVTPFWGGPLGQRPAFLIESDDDDGRGGRGTGKSTLAQTVAHLCGGGIDVRPTENARDVKVRLLSKEGLGRRVVLLDNVKTLRLSWADLESLITCDYVSGHQLYVGEARRPNTFTWLITVNNASLSKDMAQRCCVVRVKRPAYAAAWREDVLNYIDVYRDDVVADALDLLGKSRQELGSYSRWAAWERDVLARCGDAEGCQRVIADRQADLDGDQEESDLMREAFVELLLRYGHDPEKDVVHVPSAEVARLVNDTTGEKWGQSRASTHLKTLAVPELRKLRHPGSGQRGWRWVGKGSEPEQAVVVLAEAVKRRFQGEKKS